MTAEDILQNVSEVPAMANSKEDPESTVRKKCCAPNIKMFIGVLAMTYFSKSMSGSYMKSTITQIERRFEIPSSTVGIIDCSFEMGNLLVITVVSYFGAKFHRPKIIGAGSFLMALGTMIMATPHFFMGRYKYESMAQSSQEGVLGNMSIGSPCSPSLENTVKQHIPGEKGGEEGSPMWIIVLLGNMLRGIGEATITPLGVSFIDDNARPENAAFYIGCLHTIAVIGPLFGYSLGSLCARLYVDIGFVNMDSLTITMQDSRWVGAWWLGFLVAGSFNLLTSLPYWFLPRELPEDGTLKLFCALTEFLPSLKRTFTNKLFMLYLVANVFMFNGFVIIITYTPKYFEQQYGQSASTANFLIEDQWDPVCALKDITYVSPCFAGCNSTKGFGKNMTFHGCKCVLSAGERAEDPAVTLGQCPREEKCSKMFYIYLGIQSLSFFIFSLGSTPLFIICLRSVEPELKSLSVGICMLVLRVLGGIPAPIYFGALIDSTCLKWGRRKCGGRGACRMYSIQTFRFLFLGMSSSLRLIGYTFLWMAITQIKKRMEQQKNELPSNDLELQLSLKESQKHNSNCSVNTEDKDTALE
uniref:Solute carrier organic anion transporter family member n=1 Tax=Scleropages formosus TaxID=113540 RepID=A0A8C9SSH0_SCLFO